MHNAGMGVRPRDRLMQVADELFYARGLHAVGIDEIIAKSGAAKATLYAHFPTKDDLIAAYLQ
ncbi:MAG: TetR family transcriptional regulator, partial [Gemmatimonadetes bacterium]